ncbi:MAG TPA: UDP-glucose/GDP-mannose dehydrogenase family protein [Streptosporangiaceae bacterium]|jgi:UDPglucose 6-dehydrogenase
MSNRLRLTVLGAGYLGITHAACMSSLGFDVLGVDTDPAKVAALSSGRLPIYEPGLQDLLRAGLASGRLSFTTSYPRAAAFGDVHFICAGTPPRPGSDHADLSQVHNCVAALAPLLDRPCLIAGKSTVPVGTARWLATELAGLASEAELAWNPEFLREGSAVADTLAPDRIVAGVTSRRASDVLRQVYAGPLAAGTRFFATGLETAELAKVAANSFLATKISFINAMAEVCEAAGGDVGDLAEILGADARIGPAFLRAGLGFGGGCLPKDIRAFIAWAADGPAGDALGFLREVNAINLRRRARTADLAAGLAGPDLAGAPVCVLGAAFKPGSDDVRDSPALDVARILHGMGARVTVYDPVALANARRSCPELGYAASITQAARDAHVVLLLTEWAEFAGLRPDTLSGVVARRNIVDGRGVLDAAAWRAAGWTYRTLGVAAGPPGYGAERSEAGHRG